MAGLSRKNAFYKNIYFKRGLIFCMAVVAGYLATVVYERYQVERDMADRLETVRSEHEALQQRHAELSEKVEYLEGESGIESEIRKHFDVVKEGEQVVVIVDAENNNQTAGLPLQDVAVQESTEKPWYQFW